MHERAARVGQGRRPARPTYPGLDLDTGVQQHGDQTHDGYCGAELPDVHRCVLVRLATEQRILRQSHSSSSSHTLPTNQTTLLQSGPETSKQQP